MKHCPSRRSLVLVLLLLGTGCGYQESQFGSDAEQPAKPDSHGYQWHSLYREDIQTIAVPVFTNVTYRRGLEIQLTKAITQDIETHTPYKVVSPQNADTILEGEVSYASNYPLSINPYTNLPQEQQYMITVNFTWKNLRTGQVIVARKGFDQRSSYYPTLGENQDVGAADAIQRLSLSLVEELQADW